MARRPGQNPYTTKPSFSSKTWNQLSERTRRRWGHSASRWFNSSPSERKQANKGRVSAPGGTTKAAGPPLSKDEREFKYWMTRASNLARKLGHDQFFEYLPKTKEVARAYALSGGIKPGAKRPQRTPRQKAYIKEYIQANQGNVLTKRQDLTASSYPQEIYGN